MRIPEPGPFGETFSEARARAMVSASFVNRPAGGCVESVVTRATQRLPGGTRDLRTIAFLAGMDNLSESWSELRSSGDLNTTRFQITR